MSEIFRSMANVAVDAARATKNLFVRLGDSTRYKLDELDNRSRRREAYSELGEKVYDLYKSGAMLPEGAMELVNELVGLDEGLVSMRENLQAKRQTDTEREKKLRAELKAARKQGRLERDEARAAARQAREEARAAAVAAKAAAEAAQAEKEAELEAARQAAEAELVSEVNDLEAAPVMEMVAEAVEEPVVEAPAMVMEAYTDVTEVAETVVETPVMQDVVEVAEVVEEKQDDEPILM